jgi:peptide subunit release factor 1 (eRF1)
MLVGVGSVSFYPETGFHMAQVEDVRGIKDRLSGHEGPVFSGYLSVNARFLENQGQAYKVRLKDALDELGVPEAVAERVRASVEEAVHPRARSIVFFADESGLFERYNLPVDVPEAFRYGEPYLAPLVLALDQQERYGVVVVDAQEYRFYVEAPLDEPGAGSGGETAGFFKEADEDPSLPYPRGGGSTDMDPANRKQDANIHRYYKEMGDLTRSLAFKNGVRRLIVAGPEERLPQFLEALPQEVRERVVAEEHVPTRAPEAEVLNRLEGLHGRAEEARREELLAQARENGVRGVRETIEALQEGRVYHLLVLWGLDGEIRWSDADGLAILDITQEESPYTGAETRIRPLMDVIIDLADARGARLDFFREEDPVAGTPNEDAEQKPTGPAATLREEFDGLAGLLRY